jgi:hypothetical protein
MQHLPAGQYCPQHQAIALFVYLSNPLLQVDKVLARNVHRLKARGFLPMADLALKDSYFYKDT